MALKYMFALNTQGATAAATIGTAQPGTRSQPHSELFTIGSATSASSATNGKDKTMADTAQIDLETASLIRRVFLPANPNKMRNAAPEVIEAVRKFIAIVEKATS